MMMMMCVWDNCASHHWFASANMGRVRKGMHYATPIRKYFNSTDAVVVAVLLLISWPILLFTINGPMYERCERAEREWVVCKIYPKYLFVRFSCTLLFISQSCWYFSTGIRFSFSSMFETWSLCPEKLAYVHIIQLSHSKRKTAQPEYVICTWRRTEKKTDTVC